MRAAVVDEDLEGIAEASRPFRVGENGLREPQGQAWAAVNRAAVRLERAKVRSAWHTAYAELVVACGRCHTGEPPPALPGAGHGAAFAALDHRVVYGDHLQGKAASERIAGAADLGASTKRLVQLAERVRTAEAPDQQARFLKKTYGECIRCHGPHSPFRVSR